MTMRDIVSGSKTIITVFTSIPLFIHNIIHVQHSLEMI